MGLCKCPKKVVTNQFCFEHRVNVCENCMVKNHSKCIVQSYLLWLEDSDYDPNCQLCKTELVQGDCVRLVCYHVFHWECLNNFASSLPPHTAPAGYTCPICNVGIFPPSNMVSPVAELLRNTLLGVNWARCGLAFPLADESSVMSNNVEASPRRNVSTSAALPADALKTKAAELNAHFASTVQTHKTDVNRSSNRPEPYGAAYSSSSAFIASRKMYDSTDRSQFRPSVVDHDEDKYKRRSPFEFLSRWFLSSKGRHHRRDTGVLYKRWVVLVMLALIGLCTLIIFFLRMGRYNADTDPMLDPHLNPNIRVEESINNLQDTANDIKKDHVIPGDSGAHVVLPR